MTAEDRPRFTRALFVLAETFKEPMNDLRLEGYWMVLADFPINDVEHAIVRAMEECRDFFPRPAVIRDFVLGSFVGAEEAAWLEYKRLARTVGGYASPEMDAALAQTLVFVFGSWQAACWSDFTPEMWASKRKEFGRTYHALRTRGIGGPSKVIGFFEEDRGQKALTDGQ